MFSSLKSLVAISTPLLTITEAHKIYTVPSEPSNQASVVHWTPGKGGLDGPKVAPINDTTYEWWYFDAQQYEDEQFSSISVEFYTATVDGFTLLSPPPNLPSPSVNLIQVDISFPNDTTTRIFVNESEAYFVNSGNGVTAYYKDKNAGLTISPDLSTASFVIDAPDQGIQGEFTLRSKAPAHAPCGPVSYDVNLEVVPHLGWANAVPDADATACFTINGEEFKINGRGYHDKNWGDQPFTDSLSSWYWGHARLGDYSIVWFDTLDPKMQERVGSYLAKDNQIITVQCSGLTVRPFGNGTQYPPHYTDNMPAGFTILMDTSDGQLNATVTTDQTVVGGPDYAYYRWAGFIKGSIGGGEELNGTAFFEQYALVN